MCYENTKNFYFLVEICGGDILKAYKACELFGGITLTIPKKEHKSVMIKELLKANVKEAEIQAHLHCGMRTIQRFKKELKDKGKEC